MMQENFTKSQSTLLSTEWFNPCEADGYMRKEVRDEILFVSKVWTNRGIIFCLECWPIDDADYEIRWAEEYDSLESMIEKIVSYEEQKKDSNTVESK